MDGNFRSNQDADSGRLAPASGITRAGEKRYPFSLLLLIAASLPLYWYYALYNPFCYYSLHSDSSYYLGVADSLFRGGGLVDATFDPPGPVITTQHGIAFVALGLMKIGISGTRKLYLALITINYLAFIWSTLLVYRLAVRFNLSLTIALLIAANFVLSDNIFRMLTFPINDGIYFLLSAIATLMILENHDEERGWHYLLILLMSMMAAHFRLQSILVPFSASLAYLLKKEFRRTTYYLLITATSFLCVYLFYQIAISDFSGINGTIGVTKKVMSNPLQVVQGIFSQGLPILFLKFGEGFTERYIIYSAPLFVAIGAAILYACAVFIKEGHFKHVFISAVILSHFGLFFISPGMSFRYIVFLFPILLILWGIFTKDWNWGGRLLAGYLIYSVLIITVRLTWVDARHLPMKKHQVESSWIDDNVIFISQNPRFSYLVFSHPSCNFCDLPSGSKNYAIFGKDDYVKAQLAELQRKIAIRDTVYSGKYWVTQGSWSTLVRVVR